MIHTQSAGFVLSAAETEADYHSTERTTEWEMCGITEQTLLLSHSARVLRSCVLIDSLITSPIIFQNSTTIQGLSYHGGIFCWMCVIISDRQSRTWSRSQIPAWYRQHYPLLRWTSHPDMDYIRLLISGWGQTSLFFFFFFKQSIHYACSVSPVEQLFNVLGLPDRNGPNATAELITEHFEIHREAHHWPNTGERNTVQITDSRPTWKCDYNESQSLNMFSVIRGLF